MIESKVFVSVKGLESIRRVLAAAMHGSGSPIVNKAFKRWGVRYRAFAQERFTKFSRGGGNWAPLAPRTVARRRKKSSVILIDTNQLRGGLDPVFQNKPGQYEKRVQGGIRVGYGGPATRKGSHINLADIAAIHDQGLGNLPRRKIIANPSDAVLDGMGRDMDTAMQELIDRTSI